MNRLLLALFVALLAAGRLTAEMVMPTLAPVDRLVANLTAHLEQHPNDEKATFALARVHYLAYALKRSQVATFGSAEGQLPFIAPDWAQEHGLGNACRQEAIEQLQRERGVDNWMKLPTDEARKQFWNEVTLRERQLLEAGWKPAELTPAEAVAHAVRANQLFSGLIAANPREPLYRMGRASLWSQLVEAGTTNLPPPLNDLKADAVLDEFYAVYRQTARADASRKYLPLWGLTELLSHQAAQAWLKLADLKSTGAPARRAELTAHLGKLAKLPVGAITPIVFSLEPGRSLGSLLAPDTTVEFDLDGDLVPEPRIWLQPGTALLVWDADDLPIVSGRQLVGSVTWWILWENGYAVLDALDDNRDGELAGPELANLGAWFDRNSNGRSDPGEVARLDRLGIAALGVRPTGVELGCPMHAAGLRLHDGRTLPTWDWIEPGR